MKTPVSKIILWWIMMSLRIANNKIQVTDKAMPNVDQMMKEVKSFIDDR